MWKVAERKWEYVGEVVDPSGGAGGGGGGPPPGAPKHYDGDLLFPAGEYDHIFDVELGDNIMRKLPFNNGSNAIQAADMFCAREGLGKANVDQIRTFITKHSQGFATRDLSGGSAGGGAAAKPQVDEVDNTMRTSLFYDAVKIEGPKKKILEFNETDKFMDDKDLKHFNTLCEVLSNKDMFYKTKIDEYHQALLTKLLELPVDKVFPCLDLYRIFLTHPDMVTHYKNFEQGWNHLSAFVHIL
jgi:phospholipase A-2-activating protein